MTPSALHQLMLEYFELNPTPAFAIPEVTLSLDELRRLDGDAAALHAASPQACLGAAARAQLEARRGPALLEILGRCAEALSRAPAFAAAAPVTAATCARTMELDEAFGRLAGAAGDLHGAAADTLRLVAADAGERGSRALREVARRVQDPLGFVRTATSGGSHAASPAALERAFAAAFAQLQAALRRARDAPASGDPAGRRAGTTSA